MISACDFQHSKCEAFWLQIAEISHSPSYAEGEMAGSSIYLQRTVF